jgi:hypothetical protein
MKQLMDKMRKGINREESVEGLTSRIIPHPPTGPETSLWDWWV